jgi:oxalate---CoA ligase
MQTLLEAIKNHAVVQPRRPAIVGFAKNALSYAELAQQVETIGRRLRQGGLDTASRVGLAFLNGPEALVLIIAVACHATVVPINEQLGSRELTEFLENARLDALILTGNSAPELRKIAYTRGITVIEACVTAGSHIECDLVVAPAGSAASAAIAPGPDSIAVILQTSGTTGTSKLVPITHGNLHAEAVKLRWWFELTPEDRCLSFVPLHYAHGLREITFPPIFTGGSIARPKNHAEIDIIDWLTRLQPTWFSTFPVFLDSILKQISQQADVGRMHRLRFVLSSGTPLKPELQVGLSDALGVPVLEFYGIGEAGHMTANLPPPGRCKPGTCGVPVPGEMMIELNQRALGPGELGEVLVRGPTVISGYLENPAANHEKFVRGWFRTADLGLIDSDGFLSIHGRVKELINRGGEKVIPIEVEQLLLRHPAVKEAAVFAIPHPRLGQDVAAAVVLERAATITAAELRNFMRGQLTPYKIPRILRIVREIPKDVTGKIRRRELVGTGSGNTGRQAQLQRDPFEACPLTTDLIQLWRTLLRSESIGLDDDFMEHGGDSLLAVEMRLAIERLTGALLPESILLEASTVRQLAHKMHEYRQDESKALLILQPTSKADPFFFFHGDLLSGGYYVRRLAAVLNDTAKIICVAPHGDWGETIPNSIEQMARERLPVVLAAQPKGPFRLGGYCNGGTVAFELAHLLQAAGRQVEFLALIDVPFWNAGAAMHAIRSGLARVLCWVDPSRREELIAEWVERIWRICHHSRQLWRRPAARGATMLSKIKAHCEGLIRRELRDRTSADTLSALRESDRHYFKALSRYFPKRLDVPIIYYSGENSGRHLKRLSFRVDIIPGGPDHFSCVTVEMPLIANDLRMRLTRPTAHPSASNANLC